jgi:hypothetical protein
MIIKYANCLLIWVRVSCFAPENPKSGTRRRGGEGDGVGPEVGEGNGVKTRLVNRMGMSPGMERRL